MRSVRLGSIWIEIHSGMGSFELCWVYMVSVPPWDSTVPDWITFTNEPIWYQEGGPIESESTRSRINSRLIRADFVPVQN